MTKAKSEFSKYESLLSKRERIRVASPKGKAAPTLCYRIGVSIQDIECEVSRIKEAAERGSSSPGGYYTFKIEQGADDLIRNYKPLRSWAQKVKNAAKALSEIRTGKMTYQKQPLVVRTLVREQLRAAVQHLDHRFLDLMTACQKACLD